MENMSPFLRALWSDHPYIGDVITDKVSGVATKISYTASAGVAAYGTLTVSEWLAVGGLALGFLTFVINWYYRYKHLQLAREQLQKNETDFNNG